MKTIRIFISSPGDVAEEREKARLVIASLQRRYAERAELMPVLWEDLAIPATASFQEGIELILAERHRIDIAVFILWSRLGSPLGVAIKKPDGTPYRSGTEREFDLMLAAFEHSGRKSPVILAYSRNDEEGFGRLLDVRKHGDDGLSELITQRKLVKQFIQERFQDEEGHNIRAFHSYPEPTDFAQRLNIHLRGAIDDLLDLDPARPIWTEAPYRSLEAFDIQHAPIFCGRDGEICDLLQRLNDQRRSGCAFACIVGASGSGKSSLVRAGVAARLVENPFEDGVKEWRAAVFLPGLSEGSLFYSLASIIASALPELAAGPGGIGDFAKCLEDQNVMATSILLETASKAVFEKLGGSLRLLLVIDQMEELWTDRSITPEQRENFLQAIETLASSSHLSVLATLRSDFYSQAQLSPAFLRMKGTRGHFDLTPPGPAALQDLIVHPAQRAGFQFERDGLTNRTLDQRILEDAASDPSALPLLQYALAELYERRDETKRLLTYAAYDAIGGVEGALAQRAAQTFDHLPVPARAALDEILPLLVSVDIAGEQNPVRRRAPLAALKSSPARVSLTEALVLARFLTTGTQNGTEIATLAHEALLRRWDRIRSWIDTNRDLLRMRARIEQYQAMWEESGNDPSRLLPAGLPLEEGRQLISASTQVFDEKTKAFVQASSTYHDEKQRRAVRLRRAAFAVLGSLTLMASVTGFIALRNGREAERQRDVADKQREIAESARVESERSLQMIGDAHKNASDMTADILIDIRAKLEPLGQADVLLVAQRIMDENFAENELPGDSKDRRHMQSVGLNSRGYFAQKSGDFPRAEKYYTQAFEIRVKLLESEPENPLYQHDMAASYDYLGDLHLEKAKTLKSEERDPELAKAITSYRKGLDISKQLVARKDATVQWSHDLAVSYYKIGEALLKSDDPKKALVEFETGIQIAKQVAAGDLDYAKWQAHVGLFCLRLGRTYLESAELAKARPHLEEGRAIFYKLRDGNQLLSQYAVWLAEIENDLLEIG